MIENIQNYGLKMSKVTSVYISYKKLWKMMIDRDIRKKDLREMTGLSPSTIAKMGKNEFINTRVIIRICEALQCDICEIMELVVHETGIENSTDLKEKV